MSEIMRYASVLYKNFTFSLEQLVGSFEGQREVSFGGRRETYR